MVILPRLSHVLAGENVSTHDKAPVAEVSIERKGREDFLFWKMHSFTSSAMIFENVSFQKFNSMKFASTNLKLHDRCANGNGGDSATKAKAFTIQPRRMEMREV